MNQHYRDSRKIDPSKGATLGDGTPNDNDRIEIGPTQLAFAEWSAAGYEGDICGSCAQGYYRDKTAGNECVVCSPNSAIPAASHTQRQLTGSPPVRGG